MKKKFLIGIGCGTGIAAVGTVVYLLINWFKGRKRREAFKDMDEFYKD